MIDPATGEVLPDREEGELVFTSLTKQATPVISHVWARQPRAPARLTVRR